MGNQTRSYCLYILCSIVVCGWMRKIIKVTHPTITGSQPLLFFYGWSHTTLVHCRARQSTARSKCWDNGAVKGSSNPGWASCLFLSDLSFFYKLHGKTSERYTQICKNLQIDLSNINVISVISDQCYSIVLKKW